MSYYGRAEWVVPNEIDADGLIKEFQHFPNFCRSFWFMRMRQHHPIMITCLYKIKCMKYEY